MGRGGLRVRLAERLAALPEATWLELAATLGVSTIEEALEMARREAMAHRLISRALAGPFRHQQDEGEGLA